MGALRYPRTVSLHTVGNASCARSARTRLERVLDPETVRRLKAGPSADLVGGGPDLATHAIRAGMVD